MSKFFYPLAVVAFIVLVAFIYIRQNPTIIETHDGHGGRGHPHGRGSRHYDRSISQDWRYGGGSGWWGNGWWGHAQPTYFNHHHKNRHNRHHQRGGWWFF